MSGHVHRAIGVGLLLCMLILGCIWQIVSISSLYFSFPTHVFIETQFQSDDKPLPALTFCANIWNQTHGRHSPDIFANISLQELVVDIYTVFVHQKGQSLRDYFVSHAIETLSLRYY